MQDNVQCMLYVMLYFVLSQVKTSQNSLGRNFYPFYITQVENSFPCEHIINLVYAIANTLSLFQYYHQFRT